MLSQTPPLVFTVGSCFPCIYYGFFCQPVLQLVYLFTVMLAGIGERCWNYTANSDQFSSGCKVVAYIVLDPEYAKPTHRGARTRIFICFGLTGVAPVLHGLVFHGYRKLWYEMGFCFLAVSGFSYIFGALM